MWKWPRCLAELTYPTALTTSQYHLHSLVMLVDRHPPWVLHQGSVSEIQLEKGYKGTKFWKHIQTTGIHRKKTVGSKFMDHIHSDQIGKTWKHHLFSQKTLVRDYGIFFLPNLESPPCLSSKSPCSCNNLALSNRWCCWGIWDLFHSELLKTTCSHSLPLAHPVSLMNDLLIKAAAQTLENP